MKKVKSNKKILFVSYGGGHINIILPIAKEFKKKGFDFDIMGLTGARLKVEKEGFECIGYENFIDPEKNKEIFKAGETILDENYNPSSGISINESLSYLGINLKENELRYGTKFTKKIYKKAKRHSFLPINFFKKVLSEGKYDLLVTTNSPKSERAAHIAANELSIRSIRIEDLFFDDNLQIDIIDRLGEDYYLSLGKYISSPTKIFVMCKYTKSIYKNKKKTLLLNTPEKDVVVTGQPILEKIYENTILENSNPINIENEFILWAHENNTIDDKEVQELLREWLKKYSNNNRKLAFKFHPLEQENIKKSIIESFSKINSNFIVINENDKIRDWIAQSSLLVSQASTTILEAFFLKKPTIVLDPTNFRGNYPYIDTGISEIISTADQLNKKLENIKHINNKKYTQTKKSLGFKLNAVKNIVNEIIKLLNLK